MLPRMKFNRLELAGSLGDLGTLLPIAIAMILVNGLHPVGLFFAIGIFYVASGIVFGVTVPVQPMKVIGAYAIATSMNPEQILSAGVILGVFLFLIGITGAIETIRKITPQSVIRGVQLSTGALLISGGVKFMAGTSKFQELQNAAEPYLVIQKLGPAPIGIVIGILGGIFTLILLDNKKIPAGLAIVLAGLGIGAIFGTHEGWDKMEPGLHLPKLLPFPIPGPADFSFALFALVLPQLPMTLGNASLAYTELSHEYFGEDSKKITNKNACISMALANIMAFFLGGMPMCHGAGGLAAHYRFGARTAGSNLMIGGLFLALALILGKQLVAVLYLLPMAILGVLLLFAGLQLALSVMELKERKEYFVALLMLGITLATNLAAGFIAGIVVSNLFRIKKINV